MKKLSDIVCGALILMICVTSFTLISCKKNKTADVINNSNTDSTVNINNNPNDTLAYNTIQATINDTLYTFNVGTKDTGYIQTGTVRGVSGWDADINNSNTIIIDFKTALKTPVDVGSYLISPRLVDISFATQGATTFYQNIAGKSSNTVSAVISAISSTSIEGTFEGDIYFNGDKTSTKETITNGRFNFTK
jgi:hypothetical protein